jgi:transmembrane sensor
MLAADIARLNGQPDAAVAPLQQLIARFPRDKRAALAAFSLGRVLLDDLGRVAEAAAAFEQASLLAPSGPLAEGALARAVEACLQLGQRERAAKLAQRYLSRFARGTHAEAMRRMLAP